MFIKLKHSTIYKKMLFQFSIIFAAAIILICVVSYAVSDISIKSKINKLDMQNLRLLERTVEQRVEKINTAAINVITDDILKKNFSELSVEDKMYIIQKLLPGVGKESGVLASELYYYNDGKKIKANANRVSDDSWMGYYAENYPVGPGGAYLANPEEHSIVLVKGFPVMSGGEKGALSIVVNAEKLFGQEADNLTLVVDENGNRVCGNTDLYENLRNNKNYTSIISANEKSSKIRLAGKRAVISVLKSDINGWIYLRVHNYLDFYREIVILRNCLAALGLICILAGLYIYSVSIRKISSPITKMISKFGVYKTGSSGSGSKNEFENLDLIVENIIRQKELLEKFHNSSRDWAFAGIILKLCYGNVAEGEEANIEKQLAAQGFKTEGREFSAVVIQITDVGESVKQTGRIELLSDAVLSYLKYDKIVGIVSSNGDFEHIMHTVEAIKAHIGHEFGVKSHIGIGNSRKKLTDMHISFQEAFDALKFYKIYSDSEIIHINDCRYSDDANIHGYSVEKEELMFKYIKMGDYDNAEKTLDEICRMVISSNRSSEYIRYVMWQLLNAISRCLMTIGFNYEKIVGNEAKEFEDFRSLNSIDEMIVFIKDRLRIVTKYLMDKRISNNGMTVSRIKEYINGHYSEPLSLELFSQTMKLTPAYISHIFKSETGENIKSYITNVRLEKATEMISATDLTFETIAARVGYDSARSFYRAFKNKYGVTPSSFRKDSPQ